MAASEFSLELDQILHAALSHDIQKQSPIHLDSKDTKEPTMDTKLTDLLSRIDSSQKLLDKTQRGDESSSPKIARSTNAICRQMEWVDKELESIKQQVSKSFPGTDLTFSHQTKDMDPDVFDAIPSCIKSFIRQEIETLESKLPDMIDKALDRVLSRKIKSHLDKLNKTSLELAQRPPWNPGQTLADPQVPLSDTDADQLLQKLQEKFTNKSSKSVSTRKTPQLFHKKHTLSSKLKQIPL